MGKQYTAHVKVWSVLANKELDGTFVMHRPSLNEHGSISAGMSRLNQGEPFVSESHHILFLALATISVCCDEAPEWYEQFVAPSGDDEEIDEAALVTIWSTIVKARRESFPFRGKRPGVSKVGTPDKQDTSTET